jgi:hypothetical protein
MNNRMSSLSLAAGAALAVLTAAPAARADGVPAALQPASGQPLETIAARGVQVYECRADAAAGGAAKWTFVAPEAQLFDAKGALVGKHYAGPHWEAADGSRVVGVVAARADAPVAGTIPWLLLSAKPVAGDGRFARVASIQRVNTTGGATPTRACKAGETERVPYTADYVLFSS